MPRGPARPWRQLAPHTQTALPFIRAAIAEGLDQELRITEVDGDDVTSFRRGLFNAAKQCGVSVHCHAARADDGTWTLTYAVHDKTTGRAHIMSKHGGDPSRWPYDPRRRTPKG